MLTKLEVEVEEPVAVRLLDGAAIPVEEDEDLPVVQERELRGGFRPRAQMPVPSSTQGQKTVGRGDCGPRQDDR